MRVFSNVVPVKNIVTLTVKADPLNEDEILVPYRQLVLISKRFCKCFDISDEHMQATVEQRLLESITMKEDVYYSYEYGLTPSEDEAIWLIGCFIKAGKSSRRRGSLHFCANLNTGRSFALVFHDFCRSGLLILNQRKEDVTL